MPKRPRSKSSPNDLQKERITLQTVHNDLGQGVADFFWSTGDKVSAMDSYKTLAAAGTERWTMRKYVGNFATEKPYTYLNCFIVASALNELGLLGNHPPLVATFNQIRALGATVRKGSKAVARVCFYRTVKDRQTGNERLVTCWTSVFHYTQCEGLPATTEAYLGAVKRRYLGRYLAKPVQLEPDTSGVPTLQEQALQVLAAQPEATGPTLNMCRFTTRAWWPAMEDASTRRVLDQLVDSRETSTTVLDSLFFPNRMRDWSYDVKTRRLVTPPRQHFMRPEDYYVQCFRTIARAQTSKKDVRAEVRTVAWMQESGLLYRESMVPQHIKQLPPTRHIPARSLGTELQSALKLVSVGR